VCEGQDAFSISVIYRTIYILTRSHKSATKTATQMGSGNEKLDFSAEHRELLPQQIGASFHAYLFRNASDETPFMGSSFDAGNLPLFSFSERLAV
jgi:hypothetical protein